MHISSGSNPALPEKSYQPASSLRGEFAKGAEEAIHLFQRVVMYQANAQHSAFLFHLKALRQIECVVVPVPGEDATLGEKFGNRLRRMIPDAERECRAAFLKSLGVGDPVDAYTRNRL